MIYGLPDKLRELREKSGFSQNDIAKRLNVAPATVSGYERGERTPNVLTLLSLSYIYNCSVDYLLGKKQEDVSHVFVDVTELTEEQRAVINSLVNVMNKKL